MSHKKMNVQAWKDLISKPSGIRTLDPQLGRQAPYLYANKGSPYQCVAYQMDWRYVMSPIMLYRLVSVAQQRIMMPQAISTTIVTRLV